MGMKTEKSTEQQEGKKPYRPARLVTYGSLQRLTLGTKAGTKADGPDGRAAFTTRL